MISNNYLHFVFLIYLGKASFKADFTRLDGEMFLQATSLQSTASTDPGISGIISNNNLSNEIDTFNHFKKFWIEHRKNEWKGRSQIVNSFCTQIHGMFLVKLSTLMTIIGGSEEKEKKKEFVDGAARKSRREGHLLLVGDPGIFYLYYKYIIVN